MTVSNTHNRMALYSCDGATVNFDYTFEILAEEHIVAILVDSAGTETVQTLNSDYTVSGVGNVNGGTVTFSSAPSSDYDLLLIRDTTIKQATDYISNDTFPAETHEDALDKLTLITQELQEEIGRAAKVRKTSTITGLEIPVGSNAASRVIGLDSAGTQLTTYATNLADRTDIDSLSGDYDSSLSTMVSTIGASKSSVLIDVATSLDAGLTIPDNIHLIWLIGCEVTASSAKTLTINGHIDAGPYKIFGSNITVDFSTNSQLGPIPATWFPGADMGAKVNAAIAANAEHIYIPFDGDGISYSTTIDLSNEGVIVGVIGGTQLTFTGSGSAVTISNNECKWFGGRIYYKSTTPDNSNWADGVAGILLDDCQRAEVHVTLVQNFKYGIRATGGATRGTAYNQIHAQFLYTNEKNIYIDEGSSHANENDWYAKRLGCQSAEKTADQWDVYIATAATNDVNGNQFFGLSCEGQKGIYCDGTYNSFFGPRLEVTDQRVTFDTNSVYNFIFGGKLNLGASFTDNGENNCVFARGLEVGLPANKLVFKIGLAGESYIYINGTDMELSIANSGHYKWFEGGTQIAELTDEGNLLIAGTVTESHVF